MQVGCFSVSPKCTLTRQSITRLVFMTFEHHCVPSTLDRVALRPAVVGLAVAETANLLDEQNSLGTLNRASDVQRGPQGNSSTARASGRTATSRHHLLAPPFAGPADHQCIDDIGVRPQDLFDLFDEHLLRRRCSPPASPWPNNRSCRRIRQRCPVPGHHHPLPVDLREGLRGGLGIVEVARRDTAIARHPAHFVLAGRQETGVVLGEHQSARRAAAKVSAVSACAGCARSPCCRSPRSRSR